MTDITAWAAATAEDGRRTGPEKLVAQHLLDVIERWRERIAELQVMEGDHAHQSAKFQRAMERCAGERADIEAMLADLCGPMAPAAAPAVQKPGRTRKAKAEPAPEQTADFALVIPAALDRRAAE